RVYTLLPDENAFSNSKCIRTRCKLSAVSSRKPQVERLSRIAATEYLHKTGRRLRATGMYPARFSGSIHSDPLSDQNGRRWCGRKYPEGSHGAEFPSGHPLADR